MEVIPVVMAGVVLFWSTVKAKTINGEVQLHALVDGKKIIVTESTVRRDLQLEDAEGIDCLPNSTIFEELTRMGYEKISQKLTFYKAFFSPQWKFLIHTILQCLSSKTTAWNEFSSTMASAIICLATNQKFNFSKYIFESMVRNLDNLFGKFLMYPRFVQVFLNKQLDGLPSHKRIYIAPSHTKKIFGNMRRVGKDFSRKVTDLFPTMLVQNQMGEGSTMPTNLQHTPTFIQPSPPPQKTQKPRKPKRKDTQVPQSSSPTDIVADEAAHKKLGDSLVRDATTASSLEAEQDNGNITKNRSKATPNRVLDLEKTKTTQQNKIASLKRRVKKLEQKKRSRTHGLKRLHKVGMSRRVVSFSDEEDLGEDASKQGRRINAIDADENITLVNVQDDTDNEMFDVDALNGEEVFVAGQNENVIEKVVDAAQVSTSATTVTITTEEITLAQALEALKTSKPKVKGIVFQDPGKSTTTTISLQQSQDKGKGIMIEEPVKPIKKKVQIMLDEEAAKRLQAEFDEEERLAREKDEANVALTEEWKDIQAKIEADHKLAQRLQAEEQEELSDAENATLFQQLLEKRRKHFAAKRAEEQRNKPPTQAQQRKIMCTYLKNMEGKKLKDLKNKSFDSIQKMFDRAFKRVNTFVDFRTDLVEGSSKRAGEELEQESTKKQKVDEDKDTAELQSLIEVIPDEEEVAIDVVPLAIKSPSIVGWKIHKEGKKSYYQIMRADGKSQMYRIFSHMLKSFSREDLEDLYKLVKAKYESTRPVEDLDLLLWGDLKTMFEPHVEDIDATCVHLHAGKKEISPYTIYNYRYAKQEAPVSIASVKLLLLVHISAAQRLRRKTAKPSNVAPINGLFGKPLLVGCWMKGLDERMKDLDGRHGRKEGVPLHAESFVMDPSSPVLPTGRHIPSCLHHT
ncbi:hypothetical protein Tco_1312015 [Tanacetum coccineum]